MSEASNLVEALAQCQADRVKELVRERIDAGVPPAEIIAECKWTNHKINKSELGKLQEKCLRSDIAPDAVYLFSKRGFSNELLACANEQLHLIDATQIEELLKDITPHDGIRGVIQL